MDYFDRIEQVADLKGLSPSSFFTNAGMSGSTFAAAKARGTKFYPATLKKIKKAYPDVNIDYIQTGDGDPLLSVPAVIQTANNVGGNNQQIITGDPCIALREELAAAHREISQLKDKIISLLEGQQPK